ncbi:MAG: hypothetical protein EYC70_03945 [Planctomycetota bacterium]|nr:MAG: hypothetical protein EYC70_03945 [Planctomycetota bacterium]
METFSFRSLLYLTQYLALAGGIFGAVTALAWFTLPALRRRARVVLPGVGTLDVDVEEEGEDAASSRLLRSASWMLLTFALAGFAANLGAMLSRAVEVQHWPAQTMYEVIPLGTTACFLSTLVLYFVLGLHRAKGVARGFGDLFVSMILFGASLALRYVLTLDPTGRPLPPALQSYWFPTHISAYMFAYFTMFIGTLGTWLHFCFKFWRGILQPARYPVAKRTLLAIAFFAVVPVAFGRMGWALGPGVLALTGLVALFSVRFLPGKLAWFDSWEKGSDAFSWKIFMVGFPFLTAGLVQGALWAQEAWAIYWGWDSKEVSALISWLFYVVYLHLSYVAGWRGDKRMWILLYGGISVYITFQLFGHLPASQSSLHRYTDMSVVPAEGLMGSPNDASVAGQASQ